MTRLPVLASVVVAGLATGSAASAQAGAGPQCGTFVLTGGDKTINAVDNLPEGRSPGDRRVGTRLLIDENGIQVGEEVFVATTAATATADRNDLMATEFFFSFANGWLTGSALYELPNPDDPVHAHGVDLTVVVTGGAGAFKNASGEVVLKEADPPVFAFELSCG